MPRNMKQKFTYMVVHVSIVETEV